MRINIISDFVKPGDQALISISTILKFSALDSQNFHTKKLSKLLTPEMHNKHDRGAYFIFTTTNIDSTILHVNSFLKILVWINSLNRWRIFPHKL